MVQFTAFKSEEFIAQCRQKKVICFGAGKRLEYFTKLHSRTKIEAVLDNYKGGSMLSIGGRSVPVCFPDEMRVCQKEDTVIVIASLKIEDITEQLDRMKQFSGITCYAEVVLDDYIGLDEAQKAKAQQLVKKLSERTEESILTENFGRANLTASIKKYQIWEYFGATNTAGSKAREDVRQILGRMGYQTINVHCGRFSGADTSSQTDRLVRQEWEYIYETVPVHSMIMLQFPMPLLGGYQEELMYRIKREKKVCFVSLIHDVDSLRQAGRTKGARTVSPEFAAQSVSGQAKEDAEDDNLRFIMELSDLLIVHNREMERYFAGQGIEKNRLINLKIFDYLYTGEIGPKIFERSVTAAGNLSPKKSAYLAQIGKLSPLKIYLYGPNFPEDILKDTENAVYCGCIDSQKLPQKLNRGFGLIWDGSSIQTCAGGMGEYLRYNNPHKMSLYLAAGLPVIIWNGAAQAEFVKKNGVGITVSSLYEIRGILADMDEAAYQRMVHNAQKISAELRNGVYTTAAVAQAQEAVICAAKR